MERRTFLVGEDCKPHSKHYAHGISVIVNRIIPQSLSIPSTATIWGRVISFEKTSVRSSPKSATTMWFFPCSVLRVMYWDVPSILFDSVGGWNRNRGKGAQELPSYHSVYLKAVDFPPLQLCELCVTNKRDFVSSLPRYTPTQLREHEDPDDDPPPLLTYDDKNVPP